MSDCPDNNLTLLRPDTPAVKDLCLQKKKNEGYTLHSVNVLGMKILGENTMRLQKEYEQGGVLF